MRLIILLWMITLRARASCGAWVVVEQEIAQAGNGRKDKFRTSCALPECAKEFAFKTIETRVFELPLPLFERRHFYLSEVRTPTNSGCC
jgi:hypothetical protein